MTEIEKVNMVKALINDSSVDDATISVYLSLAEGKIISRCYPFAKDEKTVPKRYERIQVELAARYIYRRGVEGQVDSTENGIKRTYGSTNDEDLLKEVVQIVGAK